MPLDTLVRSAHASNGQLSIVTTLAPPSVDAPFLYAICQVTTPKGEYVAPCIRRIPEDQDEQDVLDSVLEGAISEALHLAGVQDISDEQMYALLAAQEGGEDEGEGEGEAESLYERVGAALPAQRTDEEWALIDSDPEAYGYPRCEGDGPVHAVHDYWQGSTFLSAAEVAQLTYERLGRYLCSSCAVGQPLLHRKRARGEAKPPKKPVES